jgi:predicted TIM-barrel fold metal-dependent hydrolase
MPVTSEKVDSGAVALGYRMFDADNHYYEPEDAFLRYLDPKLANNRPRWVEMADGGGKRVVFGDRLNRFLGADQTFSMVGRPGGLAQGQAGVVRQTKDNLIPIPADCRERDARLRVMDRQGVESTMLFPTFAVSVEQLIVDDVELTYSNLHAFNQWLDDDWGFNYQDRLYGVPLMSLLDPYRAVEELEFVLSRGARVVHLRPGPVAGRSPADRMYDTFWRTASDADVAVTFHSCDDPYRYEMGKVWGWGNVNVPARYIPPLHRIIAGYGRPIHDTLAALVYGKLFERFPRLRVATVELGSSWLPELVANFARAGRGDLDEEPIDTLRKHLWIAPFEDDDIPALVEQIGFDRVVMGSDYPHTDGLAEPAAFADHLKAFGDDVVRKIMRDNARALVTLAG